MNSDGRQHSGARRHVWGLAALFFFSGAGALVYEVSWTRMFSVVCGGATHALTAVLAAYMGGLALGGFLGGRLSDRRLGRPVLAYGLLEGLIGASALALTLAIPHLPPVLKALKLGLGLGGGGLDAARFLLSAVVLLVPTTLMGATFPVLVKAALPRPERLGFTAAVLYAGNALGAAAGALAGGFVLVPALGFLGAVSTAAAADGAILIVVLAVPGLRGAAAPAPSAARPDQGRRGPSAVRWVLLAGYGVSGACAMAYQVGWARALSLSLGNTTYALSIILAAYIGGLALGGAVISPLADRWRGRLLVAGAVEGVIGLAALLVMPLFEWLTARMFNWSLSLSGSFEAIQGVRLTAAFGLIVVPTTAMGALLPLVVKGMGELRGGAGEPAGEVYAANTVGAIVGAALTGYFLLGRLGVEHTLLLTAGVSVGVGMVWIFGDGSGLKVRLAGALALAAAAGAGLAWLPRWDPILMNSGPYLYAGMFRGQLERGADVRDLLNDYYEVLFYEEGVETTASVLRLRLGGELLLRVNGKTDASSGGDMATQVLCAHLPLLLHPSPKRVMMLGLASGVTAGSVLRYPIARLDCVEISPEVVRASKYFVGDSGLDYADPRFHLIIDDARNWLALSDERYDVIIIEPTNPWVAGLGSLFTREFYELLRDHLSPGGVALTWFPAYDMDAETVRLALRTFAGVFPETTVWELIPGADYFMIGSVSGFRVDLAALDKRAAEPAVAEDLARISVARGRDVFARFLMGPEQTAATAGAGPLHTDDRLELEFALPRLMTLAGEARARGIYRAVLSHHEPAFGIVTPDSPEVRAELSGFDRSRSLYYQAFFGDLPGGRTGLDEVIAAWRRTLAASPGRFPEEFSRRELALALEERAERRLASGDGRGAVADWEEAFGLDPEKVVAGDRLIKYYLGLGDEDGAGEWARRTLARMPREPFALLVLARKALAAGDPARAEADLRTALQVLPHNPQYRMELGRVLALQGRLGEAEAEARYAAAADPSSAEAQDLLSRVLASQGRIKEAEKCRARAEELRRKQEGR